MEILETIRELLADILDIEDLEITPEIYIVRDLGAESIDLLELAVVLSSRFEIEVNDQEIFLTHLRVYITEAKEQGKDMVQHLKEKLPFLSKARIEEIIADLEDGPALKVTDLVSYIEQQKKSDQ